MRLKAVKDNTRMNLSLAHDAIPAWWSRKSILPYKYYIIYIVQRKTTFHKTRHIIRKTEGSATSIYIIK